MSTKIFRLINLINILLFQLTAIGGELPQPAPCDIQFNDGSAVFARLCVDLNQKTVASLCNGKICQVSNFKKIQYRTLSLCWEDSTFSVNPDIFYKYPFEVFIERTGDRIFGKNLKTKQLLTRIYSATADAVSIELRNPDALTRLVDSLNKDFYAHKMAVQVLKLTVYPGGTSLFQKTSTGFKKVEQENDLKWDECTAR